MIRPARSALAVIAGVLAAIITPQAEVMPSAWAREHLIVPDGPRAGQRWDPALTPYAVPILDDLAPDAPYTRISVRKSAQTGLTTLMIAWMGMMIDVAPCRAMIVMPTLDALREFNADKLTPAIQQTRRLRAKVLPQTSRSGAGSTAVSKRYVGGSLVLANANSAPDLSSKTIKYIGCDEVDRWPDSLDGQGDPMMLVDARFMAFRATRDYKKFEISTPTVERASRIDEAFKDGDQRYWHVSCPQCSTWIYFQWANLKFERQPPYKAHYVAQCCGYPIEAYERNELVRAGRFIATEPGPNRHPSYHVDALVSLLVPWDDIAREWWTAQGDEEKLKGFFNLWLGLPYAVRGDAPEWERLMERRSEYAPRTIPFGGLVLTGFADVQQDGIFYEVVAWGRDAVSWVVDADFLPGPTDDARGGAFVLLDQLIERTYPDAFGNRLTYDAFGIDAGYNQHVVTTFARGRPGIYATKGMAGWFHPAIGVPTTVDINYRGKLVRNGAKLWPVGNAALKVQHYGRLRKVIAGSDGVPAGYCHYHAQLPESYFRQITAEILIDDTVTDGKRAKKGPRRTVRRWDNQGRPNHWLDCRVGNMALGELRHIGLSRMTDEDWSRLATERGVPQDRAADLFAPRRMDGGEDVAPAEPQPKPVNARRRSSLLEALTKV